MIEKSNVATCLWFDGTAEDAASFYASVIPNSKIKNILRPDPERAALLVEFTLDGTRFQALNGGPEFKLSEAVSISVATRDQEETDRLWNALIANGGRESRCGWLVDRFGLSWQIVPEAIPRLLGSSDRVAAGRAMQAMMGMKKIDVAALEAAYAGDQ